jgi:hypothetical protein
MKLPNKIIEAFKAAQTSVFGDETVSIHVQTEQVDPRGVKTVVPAVNATVTYTDCNVVDTFDEADIAAWGLKNGKDIRVSRSDVISYKIGDFIKYNSDFYRIKQKAGSDLYEAVFAELWLR